MINTESWWDMNSILSAVIAIIITVIVASFLAYILSLFVFGNNPSSFNGVCYNTTIVIDKIQDEKIIDNSGKGYILHGLYYKDGIYDIYKYGFHSGNGIYTGVIYNITYCIYDNKGIRDITNVENPITNVYQCINESGVCK